MYYVLYALNGLLMLGMPLLLGVIIARRGKVRWGLFAVGAATFVGAQVLHIPFNFLVERTGLLPAAGAGTASLLVLSLFYGLSAGVFEEGARYIVFRRWAKRARSWWQGLMVGVGHGGIEAMLLGLLFVVNMAVLIGVQSGRFTELMPPDALPDIEEQVAALFSVPWYETLLGALERLFALTVHLAMSLLVLLGVVRRQVRWLGAAILWHTLLDAVAVFTIQQWGVYVAEAAIGVFAVLSLLIIFALRDEFPSAPDDSIVEITEEMAPSPDGTIVVEQSSERLDESRFD
ncbi:MAG TPA: YhfC family glutamic-type intramembrane protease [Candidatus Sulfomarinibacteraceae bacterium]|nr:YhfC family glutamic-type intramembrane protease [Candidatus Sulfomarinibacteraceae bacterium]